MHLSEIFQQNLKRLRNTARLTQDQVSELLGVDIRNYQKYEYGEVLPRIETIEKIGELFNIAPFLLFCPYNLDKLPESILRELEGLSDPTALIAIESAIKAFKEYN